MYRRTAHFRRTQPVPENAHFASGQSALRLDCVDLRISICFQSGHAADSSFIRAW
jgi:hypothetical protein